MLSKLPDNIDVLVHIGAGKCNELDAYLATSASRIVLVEPNPSLAASLRRCVQTEPRVQVLEVAITNNPADNQLNEYNLPGASSLYPPTELRRLYPGMRLLKQHRVTTIGVEELVERCELEGEHNALVVQAPGSELEIIEALTERGDIDRFSYIDITCSEKPLYESPSQASEVLALVHEQGFDTVNRDDSEPDWPRWTLRKNALKKKFTELQIEYRAVTQALEHTHTYLERLKAETAEERAAGAAALTTEQEKNASLSKEVDGLKQYQADTRKQLESTQTQLEQVNAALKDTEQKLQRAERELANAADRSAQDYTAKLKELREANGKLQKQLEEAEGKLHTTEEQLQQAKSARRKADERATAAEKRADQAEQKIAQLEQQLSERGTSAAEIKKLDQRLEYFFGQHTLQLEQAANALGHHVTSTVTSTAKELEAGIALQQQFGRDLPSLEEQGNKLPATVALQLSRQLKSKPYDVIIEFGSGVTTTFMARTLRNQPSNKEEAEGTELARYVDPSEDDLPKRIICFEHNRAKYNELTQKLKESGLAPVIKLQHAPLVAYQHQGQEHLYYDCAIRLQQLAKLFEDRQARIFVLLNHANGNSRPDLKAALPQLLQHLSAHSLDVVVSNVSLEPELATQWHQLLDSRDLDYRPVREFGTHGLLVKINP